MEQARYWMWTKRKHEFGAHVLASPHPYGDSWEEQAFAEDASGPLGGCIWPPRSYSCSFCRREFKSAQALGGHMNVHRRDRARLKQSPKPHGEGLPQNHILNPCSSLDLQYEPPQICTYLYNRSSDSDQEVVTSPSSPIRVSAPPTKIDCEYKTLAPRLISPIIHDNRKNSMSTTQSWSNLVADSFHVSDLKNEDKISKLSESNCKAKGEYVKADLAVSLNLLVCRTHTNASDAEDTPAVKKRKIDASSFTLFPKSSSAESCHHPHSEVLKLSPSSIEDLDLELRLGDPPKVK